MFSQQFLINTKREEGHKFEKKTDIASRQQKGGQLGRLVQVQAQEARPCPPPRWTGSATSALTPMPDVEVVGNLLSSYKNLAILSRLIGESFLSVKFFIIHSNGRNLLIKSCIDWYLPPRLETYTCTKIYEKNKIGIDRASRREE